MALLDGGLAATFSAALSGVYLDARLHRVALGDDGQGGGAVDPDNAGEPVKAQLDSTTDRQRAAEGYADTDQRILVLAAGIDPISTDDQITVAGVRWAIASVSRDPACAYFDLRGRRA